MASDEGGNAAGKKDKAKGESYSRLPCAGVWELGKSVPCTQWWDRCTLQEARSASEGRFRFLLLCCW